MSTPVVVNWPIVELAIHAWVVATSGIPGDRVIWSGRGKKRPNSIWISLTWTSLLPEITNSDEIEENPLTFPPTAVSEVFAGAPGVFEIVGHPFQTGDGPVQLTTTGVLPAPLALDEEYFVVVQDEDAVQLSGSFDEAMASVPLVITIANVGTGTMTISATDETLRAGEEINHVVTAYLDARLSIQCYAVSPTGNDNPMAVLAAVAVGSRRESIRQALVAADIYVGEPGRVNNVGAVISTSVYEPRAAVDIPVTLSGGIHETGGVITNVEAGVTLQDQDVTAFDVTIEIP